MLNTYTKKTLIWGISIILQHCCNWEKMDKKFVHLFGSSCFVLFVILIVKQ